MKTATILSLLILPLLGAGCGLLLGDSVPVCSVSVKLSLPGAGAKSVSLDEPEVRAALDVVDDALVARGFSRQHLHPPDANLNGRIADYTHNQAGTCFLSLKDNTLICSYPHYIHYSDPNTADLCSFLAERLIDAYGRKRVTLNHHG